MKVKTVNVTIIDMSEAEDCTVDMSKLPTKEEFLEKITETFKKLKQEGVTEIEELNICALDLSEAEKINIK